MTTHQMYMYALHELRDNPIIFGILCHMILKDPKWSIQRIAKCAIIAPKCVEQRILITKKLIPGVLLKLRIGAITYVTALQMCKLTQDQQFTHFPGILKAADPGAFIDNIKQRYRKD